MKRIRRSGAYLRVADPDWDDPLDGSFSRIKGGRWNAPGSFPVVYLNRSEHVAHANVDRKYDGLPYGPEDVDPDAGPDLVETRVPQARYVDIVRPYLTGSDIADDPEQSPTRWIIDFAMWRSSADP